MAYDTLMSKKILGGTKGGTFYVFLFIVYIFQGIKVIFESGLRTKG